MMKSMILILTLSGALMFATAVHAQDTLQISLEEFIRKGIDNSGKVAYERQNVSLADNRIQKTQSQRFLPEFDLSTQHGLVPGVKSEREDLARDELYLDPELENDFDDLGLFTRAEINAVQPLFAWGALRNAVKAAESAAEAARERFESQKAGMVIRLFDLYHSYIFTLEVNRLLKEARDKIERVDRQIQEKKEADDYDIDESDVFKFEIFKSEFAIQEGEIKGNTSFIKSVWEYILQPEEGTVYEPETSFLDPVGESIEELNFYRLRALEARPEIKAVEAGIEAAKYGIKATKAQSYPSLLLGLSARVAHTPNRPRQDNPFIVNNTNFASVSFGLGFRQNLDFFSIKTDLNRSKIQHRQAQYLKEAAQDNIVLEINEKYKNVTLSKLKVDQTEKALVTGKKWLRQEELDYDFGIGEVKDLVDALKKELELRVQLKRNIFEFNKDMAELYKASGMDISTLKMIGN